MRGLDRHAGRDATTDEPHLVATFDERLVDLQAERAVLRGFFPLAGERYPCRARRHTLARRPGDPARCGAAVLFDALACRRVERSCDVHDLFHVLPFLNFSSAGVFRSMSGMVLFW